MCKAGKIAHEKVDFASPKVIDAEKVILSELPSIAEKMCETHESFRDAYQRGLVLVGIFKSPCGKYHIFIEYNKVQLLAPFRYMH